MQANFIYALLSIILCISPVVLTYQIPNVKVELLSEGFRVSIPHESGMKKVFYIIELSNWCPAHLDYLIKSQNNLWTTDVVKRKLQENDYVAIALMVEHDADVHIHEVTYEMKNGQLIKAKCSNNANALDQCDPPQTNSNTIVPNKANCQRSQTITQQGRAKCVDDLLFEETFDRGLQQWNYDIRLGLNGEHMEEFVLYNDKPENIFINNGILNIKPTIEENHILFSSVDLGNKCTPVTVNERECVSFGLVPPVNSAQVHTKNHFNFKYGRIEVRAKLPKGDWLVPHILLKPVSGFNNYWIPQMVIAYARGNEVLLEKTDAGNDIGGSRLYAGNSEWRWGFYPTRYDYLHSTKTNQHLGNDFHTYSLTWTESNISVAIDGNTYGTITENMSKFREQFYITLGVSSGGHYEFPDELRNSNKPWTNTDPKAVMDFWKARDNWKRTWNGAETMQIDYVRVFAV